MGATRWRVVVWSASGVRGWEGRRGVRLGEELCGERGGERGEQSPRLARAPTGDGVHSAVRHREVGVPLAATAEEVRVEAVQGAESPKRDEWEGVDVQVGVRVESKRGLPVRWVESWRGAALPVDNREALRAVRERVCAQWVDVPEHELRGVRGRVQRVV